MQKPQALAISLGLHAATFLGLMYIPPFGLPTLPPPSPGEYQQGFAGKEDKIVWYKFHDLPDIAPSISPKARKPLRADIQAKQAIVSSPKNAPKRKQVVVTEAPAIDLPALDLPNLIAVKLPPKQFTTPPDLVKPGPPEIKLLEAPETSDVPTQELDAAQLPVARLPARPYIPPPTVARIPAKIEALTEAPKYDAQAAPVTKIPAVRLPSRAYVPPPPQAPPPVRRIAAAAEAPAMAMEATLQAPVPEVKLPARAYRPPPPPSTTPRSKPSIAPPPIDGPAGDVTIAVAGLNPATIPVKLPAASSPAQFSAGPTPRPDGATSEGTGKGIVVPDLYAHAGSETKPDLLAIAVAPPTPSHRLPAATFSTSTVAREGATRVSNAPDSRFNGRDVYMMAIQMSNLTSYSGSWLMWYADRAAREDHADPISPPVPHRKVDPKYSPAAQADHVEGRVQLYCVVGRDGNVSSIELLRGADERLNRSAEEALSKWEFYPATRDGQPVDVDVVVEIPFVLAPPPLK